MLATGGATLQLSLLLALCLFSIQGTHGLLCYSCKDTGDGGCSIGMTKLCAIPNDVCVQTFTTVNISFTSFLVLTKGCGSNASSESPIQKNREAIATVTEIEVCNTDLCNSRLFDAAIFPLANKTMNTSTVNTTVDCYGCISIKSEECSDRRASNLTCDGNTCAQGSLQIQLHNKEFLTVYFKDCGRWGPFHEINLIGRAGLGVFFRRSVCTGALCNQEPVPTTTTRRTEPVTTKTTAGSTILTKSHLLLALVLATVFI